MPFLILEKFNIFPWSNAIHNLKTQKISNLINGLTSLVTCLLCCLNQVLEIKNYAIWMASDGIIFTPSCVEISQLVQNLKWKHTHVQYGYRIRLIF
jgi:hypothetical protein